MDLLWKGIGTCLVTCILVIALGDRDKQVALVISLGGMIAVSMIALHYLRPVADLLAHLEEIGSLHTPHLEVLIKAVGIGLITELTALLCADMGKAGLAKILQFLGSCVILWQSIPAFEAILDLIGSVLGGL